MRSSSGEHFVALDHLRALAAFLVVAWHFLHTGNGTPVTFEGAPALFPLALADEGHTGVALFMVLSGYLFAKLLHGRSISYPAFLWNRFLRLAPLLCCTFALVVIENHLLGRSNTHYLLGLLRGLIYPVWPNGGWSITTEIHFYLALPLLLALGRRSRAWPLVLVMAAIALRHHLYVLNGEVQSLSYWTIVGRIDQFVLGILAHLYAAELTRRRPLLLLMVLAFTLFWWWFDSTGGFYQRPFYPSPSALWIWIPTIEGLGYAALILWYDSLKITAQTLASRVLQRLGEYSYSIYLLHFFFVFRLAEYVDEHVMDISNFYVGLLWSTVFFVAMLLPGYLSFRFIESPFLRLRVKYTR